MQKPRMRLAYLTTEYPKVSHTFIRREILELERRGHEVLRLAIRHPGGAIADQADREEAERTVHFVRLPKGRIIIATIGTFVSAPLRWLSALLMTVKMSRASERGLLRHLAYLVEASTFLPALVDKKVQHLHVHFGTNAAAVARLIRRLGGPGYSMTVHGPGEFDAPLGFSLREKGEDAEFVVAISDFCFAQLCRWMPPEQWSKIHVVHCSVGDVYFASGSPVDESSRMLLSIGRLTPQKGQFLLLDAVKEVVRKGLDVQLVLAGDGELRQLIETRIREYGLTQHVEVTGWLDDAQVRDRLMQCRALVQPSFAEGLPVVIMEAFAMGRPVISTHVAGIPELVRQHENGWLVPVGNVEELVMAIELALGSTAETLTKMGKAGRGRARTQHHIEEETAVLERLFEAATNARRTSEDTLARTDPGV